MIDPLSGDPTTAYAYHPFGELASITDAATNVTSWTYNIRGFVTGTSDPDSGSWSYEANAFGETTYVRDAKTTAPAWTTQLTFDKLGRPKTRLDVPESLTTTWNWGNSAANKNFGRLASVTMSAGGYSEAYFYDPIGRLAEQKVTADGTPYHIYLTYVPTTGLLETLQYPVSTGPNPLTVVHEYSNGLLKRVKEAGGSPVFWEAVSTDAFGRVQDEIFGNGVRTFTDFDQASGLMSLRTGGVGGGTGLIHSVVDWDLNGNLTERVDNKLNPAVTELFEYDALDRLVRSTRNGNENLTVAFDAIGNIQSKLGVGIYGYHATKKRAVISAGSNSFGYDANGNMTSRNGQNIGYTSYNLPNVINAPGGYSSALSYGAFRNRYKQVAVGPQGTETTIYVAGLMEKVTRASGTEYRHYIHGGQGAAAIYTRASSGSNSTYYVHTDHLGSPELITNSAGAALVRPSFAAYGERRDGTDWDGAPSSGDLSTIANISRRGFTGHEHLDAVGLIHMNGRVYEPVAGRFLSRDPFVDGVASSQGINGYAYVHNNPLTLIDPSGYCGDLNRNCPLFLSSLRTGPTGVVTEAYIESGGPGRWNRFSSDRRAGADAVSSIGTGLQSGGPGVMYGVDGELNSAVFRRALDWLRNQGLIDFTPTFVDEWAVKDPNSEYLTPDKQFHRCKGEDPFCDRPRWDRVAGATFENGDVLIFRGAVVRTPQGPEEVADETAPHGHILVSVGEFTAVEIAIYTIMHESWHRDNPQPPPVLGERRPSVEHHANRRGFDVVLIYREWWRRGRP